jgi:hypothetical protein
MQPTYFPWVGYFKMINDVNLFIFLDDAQYSKGSWHSRNKILNKSKEIWLTISLKKHKLNYQIYSKYFEIPYRRENNFQKCQNFETKFQMAKIFVS